MSKHFNDTHDCQSFLRAVDTVENHVLSSVERIRQELVDDCAQLNQAIATAPRKKATTAETATTKPARKKTTSSKTGSSKMNAPPAE